MFTLGLTGSIATGKSTVLKIFAERGIPIYSADETVHALYQGAAVAPVGIAFPSVVQNGVIDRQKLGKILVDAPQRIKELERIVHPLVGEKMQAFLTDTQAAGAAIAVLEIPLLFESGRTYPVDAVAVTYCDDAEQRQRALARPGMDVEKLETILARQTPQAEKKSRADFIIDTNTGIDDTRRQIDDILEICHQRQAAKEL